MQRPHCSVPLRVCVSKARRAAHTAQAMHIIPLHCALERPPAAAAKDRKRHVCASCATAEKYDADRGPRQLPPLPSASGIPRLHQQS
jgi:hypothetical protein